MSATKLLPELSEDHPRALPWVMLLCALGLFAYVAIRSATIDITIDEAYSWKFFSYGPHLYPQKYDVTTANDHWLNSWLVQLTGGVFGPRNWALRLPNVLAFAVYLFFTARFVLSFRARWYTLAAFLLLNVHPYLLDFFSAERGYGLAFGAMSACIFFLFRFSGSLARKDLCFFLLAGCLAVLANFAVISFFMVALGMAVLLTLLSKNADRKKLLLLTVCVSVPFLAIVVPHLFHMQHSGALYYGENSLWEGTAKSVFTSLL
ncbi:MAG TPA: hypothetical protein VFU15_10695, partial [Bacteroidia bacterium]|nr:hypothetical protein [Bacteroidia bacterium]